MSKDKLGKSGSNKPHATHLHRHVGNNEHDRHHSHAISSSTFAAAAAAASITGGKEHKMSNNNKNNSLAAPRRSQISKNKKRYRSTMDMLSGLDSAIEDSVHHVGLQDKHKSTHHTPHHADDDEKQQSMTSTFASIKSFKEWNEQIPPDELDFIRDALSGYEPFTLLDKTQIETIARALIRQ